ncbi:hypothetical protein JXM83_07250 [Candidatus Woesearchaeota archaeon]|nr:hypothetical protein [Candidatus Woesearchaeota archaeon]
MAFSVLGATHLNITIVERVNQTVYFNYDANLSQNITYYNVTGIINVTNPANETLYDVYVTFTNTDKMITNLTNVSGRPGEQISGTPGTDIIVHIPELRENESTIFAYLLEDNNTLTPPLLMESNYTHPGWAKILADRDMEITSYVENQAQIGYPIENINISIKAQYIDWGGDVQWFRLHNLENSGDFASVTTHNDTLWYWESGGTDLNYGERQQITYLVHVPANIPDSGFYNATIDEFSYTIGYALSNLTVTEINASAKAEIDVQKEIWAPTMTSNVTWRATPRIGTDTDITFDLKAMTVWVTRDMDPNNYTGLNYSYPANNLTTFNSTDIWGGNESEYAWFFNYTDGSDHITSPPPIVWMDPTFIIFNGLNQLVNQSITQSANDVYIRQIYIINGFWLEVDKNITNIAEDMYQIKLWVHNKGTGWTPTNLTVTVYDFVPQNFTAWNYTPFTPNQTRSVGGGSEVYTGEALMWYIGLKSPKNASLAPNNDTNTLDEWNTTYIVNGTGDFRVSDLYIVGLDPQLVDGNAGVSPLIEIQSGLINFGRESMFALISFILATFTATGLLFRIHENKNTKTNEIEKLRAEIREIERRLRK